MIYKDTQKDKLKLNRYQCDNGFLIWKHWEPSRKEAANIFGKLKSLSSGYTNIPTMEWLMLIERVREISSQLRPGVLDDLGLTAAIEWQTQEFQSQMGIRCKFNANSEDITLDPDKSTAVFRIFQETLTNVARHAKATGVSISLMKMSNNLLLKVRDNGKGIEEDKISSPKSLGLLGMRERARLLGGNFEITSTQGKGTTVTLQVPLSN